MPRSKKKIRLSKDAILFQAKEFFSKKGYKGTSLEDLTRVFGVSKPAIYYYFKSKMDILLDLHATGFKKAEKGFDEILSTDLPIKQKLGKILKMHVENIISDIELHRVFYLEEIEMPKRLRRKIKNRRKEYTNKVAKLYENGIKEGSFNKIDPNLAVYFLLGACNWLIMWYSTKKSSNPELVIEDLMKLFREGYEISS
jgi:AcrR family transcriptional regulator